LSTVDDRIKALAAAYEKFEYLREEFEVAETTFEILANKMMKEMQEHPANEGKMWEKDEPFHLSCEDCMGHAGRVALKIVREADENDDK